MGIEPKSYGEHQPTKEELIKNLSDFHKFTRKHGRLYGFVRDELLDICGAFISIPLGTAKVSFFGLKRDYEQHRLIEFDETATHRFYLYLNWETFRIVMLSFFGETLTGSDESFSLVRPSKFRLDTNTMGNSVTSYSLKEIEQDTLKESIVDITKMKSVHRNILKSLDGRSTVPLSLEQLKEILGRADI